MKETIEQVGSYLDGSVVVHKINGPFLDHEGLIESIDGAGLKLSDFFPELQAGQTNPQLTVHPTIRHDQRSGERDPISTEYIPHFDGCVIPTRPLATFVVARVAGVEAPPTRFISTVGLFELAKSKGIFDNIDPAAADILFSQSAYYSQAQQFFKELEPDNPELQKIMEEDLKKAGGATNLEELVAFWDNHPEKGLRRYPLVSPHIITGEDAIMVDAGVRSIKLVPREEQQASGTQVDQRDLDHAMIELRLLLADNDQLEEAKITTMVTPVTGHGVAFSREALHNQMPPASERQQKVARQISVIGLIAA